MKRVRFLKLLTAAAISATMLISTPICACGLGYTLEPVNPNLVLVDVKPAAPTGMTASLDSDMVIQLAWTDNSSNETGFVVQRKFEGGTYADMETLSMENVTGWFDKLEISDTSFGTVYYRVRAFNSFGSSAYSNEVSVKMEQPQGAQNLTLNFGYDSGKGAITLLWTNPSPSLTDYFIIHRITNSGADEKIAKISKTEYVDKGLADNTTYTYQVETRGYIGGGYSTTVSYKTPEAAPATVVTSPAVSTGPDLDGASDWAKPELQEAYDLDLTTDAILNHYSKNITREEFCEIAVKLYEALSGKTALTAIDNPFSDTTNKTVLKAFNLGIIKGTSDTSFSPDNSITRQEICVMIYRTLQAADPDLKTSTSGVSAFTDESSIAPWAIDAVRFASKNGIMKGTGGGNINPLNNTSREQAIVLLKRTYDSFK